MNVDMILAGLRSPGHNCCESIREAAKLIERWRTGNFTKDEIHDFCHNLHGTVSAVQFAEGCTAEQRKIYGCAPDADRLAAVKKHSDRTLQRLAAESFKLYEDILDAANENDSL